MPIERYTRKRGPWRHEQTVTPVAPTWAPPVVQPRPEPKALDIPPGTTVWRTLDRQADIDPLWSLAVRAALPIGVIAGAGFGWYTLPRLRLLWLGIGAIALVVDVLFLALCRDLFIIAERDKRLRVQERESEQAAIAQAVEPQRHLVTIHVEDGHGGHRYLNDIDVTPELQRFAQRVVSGSATFSEGGAKECGLDVGVFKDLRDQMMDRALISWKNPNNHNSGYRWHGGMGALRTLAEFPLPRD